ncbi:hypothetical protein BRADI_4g34877v3 [Brachypodium distachyon]|uniref:DUF4283 domain-containing protein n=1 Tax=Brachypodium distachyon TaxID=15368 RepID=A0A0Q3HBV3_BRADI|nr:hypothetical protein BRADI_4g34877v3 [Brachypodium distachyon]
MDDNALCREDELRRRLEREKDDHIKWDPQTEAAAAAPSVCDQGCLLWGGVCGDLFQLRKDWPFPSLGFYHLELAASGDDEKASNSALVSIQTTQISSQLLEDELKNLFEEEWDWQVKQLSVLEFAVVFPSKESLRFACKSGRLVLPLNQVLVSIREEEVDAEASSVLSEVWLKLSGIPRKIRDPEILVVAFQMLGKAIEVDGSSLTRNGPVRMKFQCRNPKKIRGSLEIFIHKIAYKIKVVLEMPTGASKPPPVPPSEDSHGDDSADPTIDEEEWERLGKHDKERKDTTGS